jgi:dCMP deaminase
MDMALHTASWSKDTSRQVGAIVFNPITHAIVSQGYNGFPRGADDSLPERMERPLKYLWTAHAETNCIYHAARHGVSLEGMSIISTLYPCAACALAITQSGLRELITYEPDWINDRFAKDFAVTAQILRETQVSVRFLEVEELCRIA